MNPTEHPPTNGAGAKINLILAGVVVAFAGLAVLLVADIWGRTPAQPPIPLVDPAFLETTPVRQGYADLVAAKEDLSDFDCYACHEKNKPPPLKFDANHKIIIPKEHSNITLNHGSHDRNNLCYNCHNEQNFLTFQARDGRLLKFEDSSKLCGSCHGPTYGDWEGGAHGRTSGFWDRKQGEAKRLACVNCHDPHSPQIPSRPPAPGPHTLHELEKAARKPAAVKPAPSH